MKGIFFSAVVFAVFVVCNALAKTHYVNVNGISPVPPYTNWVTAATNIQDAVNSAASGDLVLVTNGIYQYGEGVVSGQTNRVAVPPGVILNIQSVNGPSVTVIKGYQMPGSTNGVSSVRCVYLSESSILSGFTLTNGSTVTLGNGGGVFMESDTIVSNCIITGNAADNDGGGVMANLKDVLDNCTISGNVARNSGGGAYECVLSNCVVNSNSANYGGGLGNGTAIDCLIVGNGNTNSTEGGAAYISKLNNCTVAGNFSRILGAADGCTLVNSIIYYNSNGTYVDCYQCQLTNCCTPVGLGNSSLPANCISNAPLFANLGGGDYHLSPASPCINAGTNPQVTYATDLDGNPRIVGGIVDMGAYEFQAIVHYVLLNGTAPVSPYTNWLEAATNIQNAIDDASTGDFIVVSNGLYQSGGRAVYDNSLNSVALDKPVTVQSVNGPSVTTIAGSGAQIGNMRCAYLTNGATLSGFTLTNGWAEGSGTAGTNQSGGGVWCESALATVSNCVLIANHAIEYGGGAYQGTLNNCSISNNLATAIGGGTYGAILNNCLVSSNECNLGGGVAYTTLSNCVVTWNFAGNYGGGAYASTLNYCSVSNNTAEFGGGTAFGVANFSLISSNLGHSAGWGAGAFSNTLNNCILRFNAGANGGGAYHCALNNCTVVSNSASSDCGGVNGGGATNSIVYYNISHNTPSSDDNFTDASLRYCDTFPLPAGFGNITNPPSFVNLANDCHLQSNSPCINSGYNAFVVSSTDFDGTPRIQGGTVDMGAYEYQTPASIISYAWLEQYGLPTDGSVDFLDLDGTGMKNWQKAIAGLNPTNSASVLAMLPPVVTNTATGATVSWQSVNTRIYYLQRATNLAALPAFSAIQSNIVGQAGTTSFFDATATNSASYFYRVGVQ